MIWSVARLIVTCESGDDAMAFQPVVNTVEIDVIYTLNGQVAQNVFYAKFGGTYAQANLQALADEVDTQVGILWLPFQPIEAEYLRTEVRGLTVENDLTATANAGAGPGEDVSPSLPNQVTFSVKRTSLFTGRSARGRTYWIGIPKDKLLSTDENRLVAQYVSDVVGVVDALRSNINLVFLWDAVLVSRVSGGVLRDPAVTFDWIDTVAVNNVVDTQRGRLPK